MKSLKAVNFLASYLTCTHLLLYVVWIWILYRLIAVNDTRTDRRTDGQTFW